MYTGSALCGCVCASYTAIQAEDGHQSWSGLPPLHEKWRVAIGTTPKPLLILVCGIPHTTSTLQRLVEQGHSLTFATDSLQTVVWQDWDLIIGPKCWRTLPDLKYLDVTLKQARKERYG